MDCSQPGSFVPGIFQARILEWVAISFSRRSPRPRDWTCVSFIGRWIFFFKSLNHPGSRWFTTLGLWDSHKSGCVFFYSLFLLSFYFNFYFILEYNVLVLGVERSDSNRFIYVHLFFLKFFSHVDYYGILSRVPCAIQRVFVSYPFYI